jgi:hypothetical protein
MRFAVSLSPDTRDFLARFLCYLGLTAGTVLPDCDTFNDRNLNLWSYALLTPSLLRGESARQQRKRRSPTRYLTSSALRLYCPFAYSRSSWIAYCPTTGDRRHRFSERAAPRLPTFEKDNETGSCPLQPLSHCMLHGKLSVPEPILVLRLRVP